MSDVKLDVTPSAEVVAQARQDVIVTDPRGRAIKLRKPGVLSQYRFVKMVGGEAATNPVYMGMVLPLLYVESIDADPVIIGSERALDALITRLDEDGIAFVQQKVSENFGGEKASEEKKDDAKN